MWLSLVRVSTLSFLQCIDTVGLVTAETSGWPIKILRSSFTEQMAEGHWWQTSNQGAVGKRPLKGWCCNKNILIKLSLGTVFLNLTFSGWYCSWTVGTARMQSMLSEMVRHPSTCLSQHGPTAVNPLLQVCCCGPGRQEILITAGVGKCRQCHIVSIHR